MIRTTPIANIIWVVCTLAMIGLNHLLFEYQYGNGYRVGAVSSAVYHNHLVMVAWIDVVLAFYCLIHIWKMYRT